MNYTYESPYYHRPEMNDKNVTILKTIDKPDKNHDVEALPMHLVQFDDGETMEVYPEELFSEEETAEFIMAYVPNAKGFTWQDALSLATTMDVANAKAFEMSVLYG